MKATYDWVIGNVFGKKTFTDKYNNVRENVIRQVELFYVGKLQVEEGLEREEKERTIVNLDIFNLNDFKPIDKLSKKDILSFALNTLNPKEKQRIENTVKGKFDELEEDSNLITIILNDE